MKDRYIAFDVETPNYANDRMSSIGIAVIENAAVVDEFYSLVNPETYFNRFNIELTGITPEMVSDMPAFPKLWEMIAPVMGSGLLIAHNAPFDMSVLAKCLSAYQIGWKPYAYYACTCAMGRSCYPNLVNHKLSTLSGHLGLELEHHNAGSDSRACAELLLDYMRHNLRAENFIRRYDMRPRGMKHFPED